MTWKFWIVAAMATAVAGGAGVVAWRFAFFVAPYAWTQEPERLRNALSLRAGARVADIGAGDGSMSEAIAAIVGTTGIVYASELDPERRQSIEERVRDRGLSQIKVIEGAAAGTNLASQCCDGIYLRAVFHHIDERDALAASIRDALAPGGRVAVIDFAPGTMWFHGDDHGVTPDAVIEAFRNAGLPLVSREDDWGGGMFLLVFERRP